MRGGPTYPSWDPGSLAPLGDRVSVVLGGGGIKGLAHVGVWQALEEAGVAAAAIVGTSIGALVGACISGGMGWRDLAPLALALRREDIVRIDRRVVWVNGVRLASVFRGGPLRDYIARALPVTDWNALRIPLQINAVDLESGEEEWFGHGARTDVPLVDAIYASCALPVLYPPAQLGEGFFVDGGVAQSLPLRRAVEIGSTGVIGVDVGSGPSADPKRTVRGGMISIHQRVFSVMAGHSRRAAIAAWNSGPLLLVRPRLDGYETFDFGHIKFFLEEGYRAARAALIQPEFRGAGGGAGPVSG
jgi:NTE family protein